MPKTKKSSKLPDMIKKTLTELVKDLSCIDGKAATKLEDTIRDKKNSEIVKEVSDTGSVLYKSIPIDTLRKDVQGRKYLDILALIQPAITESITALEKEDSSKAEEKATKAATEAAAEAAHELASSADLPIDPLSGLANGPLGNIFEVNDDNRMLIELAREISSSVNYEPTNGTPNATDFMELMTKVSEGLQEKIEKGDIDVNALETQARGFMERMQSVPELSNMMQNPELMASLMGGMGM